MAATDADSALVRLGREVLAEVLANATLLEQGREDELLELSWVRPFQRFERGRVEQVRGYSTMRQPGLGWIPEPDWERGQQEWIAKGEAIWKAHEWKPHAGAPKSFGQIADEIADTHSKSMGSGSNPFSTGWSRVAVDTAYRALREAGTGAGAAETAEEAREQLLDAYQRQADAMAVSTSKKDINRGAKALNKLAGHLGDIDLAMGANPARTLGALRTVEDLKAGRAHRAELGEVQKTVAGIWDDMVPAAGERSQSRFRDFPGTWKTWRPVSDHVQEAQRSVTTDPGQAYHELLAAHQLLGSMYPYASSVAQEAFITRMGDRLTEALKSLDTAMGAGSQVTDALDLQKDMERAQVGGRVVRSLLTNLRPWRDDIQGGWFRHGYIRVMAGREDHPTAEDARELREHVDSGWQKLEQSDLLGASAELSAAHSLAEKLIAASPAAARDPESGVSDYPRQPGYLQQWADRLDHVRQLIDQRAPAYDAGAPIAMPGDTISGMTGGVEAGAQPGDTLSGSAFADLPPAEIPPSQMPLPELRPILASEVAGTNSREVNLPEYLMLAQQGKALLDGMGRTSRPLWYDSLQYVSVEAHKQGGPDYRPEERASEDAWQATRQEWGGATIDAHTGRVLPQGADKYALSVKPQGEVSVSIPLTSGKQQFAKAFDYASKKFSPLLTLDNHYLGVFRDEEAGRIDFDPVVVVDTAAEAEAIGTYTHAIGGAYHFQDGKGLYPPHLPDPEIAKMAAGDLPTPLHTVARYLSQGGVVAERMSDGGWRWQGRSSPDWHQMSESSAATMPAEVAPGGIWREVKSGGTPTGAAQRFGTAKVSDFTFTGTPDLAQIPRDIVARYVPPGLLGVLSQTKMGGVQLSFRALDQFSAAQDAKWLSTDAVGRMLLKSSAAFYTTWDNRVELRDPWLRGDTGTQAVLHETGHALDYALGSPSEGEDFNNLLHAILSDPQSNAGDYYKAPREAWAEMFASHMRDEPAVSRGMQFSPESWKDVRAYFHKLGIYTGQQEADVRSRELGDLAPPPQPKAPRREVLSSPKPLEGYDLWVGSKEGRTSVSERDAQAARHVWYSYNYNKTNTYLRTGHSTYGKVNQAYAEDLQHFIGMVNRAPPFTQAATVYRGVEDGAGMFGPVGSRVGQEFTDKGLVSTSANEELARETYAPEDLNGIRTVVRVTLAPGVRALKSSRDFWVEPGTSAWDQQNAIDSHERHQEYTLPPGTTFVITSDTVQTAYDVMDEPIQVRYVDVEVVPG